MVRTSLWEMSKDSQKKRYQSVLGKSVTGDLTDTIIDVGVKATSYVLPIDDVDETSKDLKKNDLVTHELSTFAGYIALNGGRLVALTAALFIVAKYVKLGKPTECATEAEEPEKPLVMGIE